ncbi:CTP synthetase [uncultured Shimia sp.]|uniref:CTP synthetase n=1 Tax=uncultured Shimia sp. TaxID=573152 RepID=UPI002619F0A2|nr:CTP synthetase [uncultured Shimia sp.]
MLRLSLILHLFIGATLSGVAVVAALIAGVASLWAILDAALAGYVIAFPVSHIIARKLYDNG